VAARLLMKNFGNWTIIGGDIARCQAGLGRTTAPWRLPLA
jgi:hypothetical protein